jgi:hypothetical protein
MAGKLRNISIYAGTFLVVGALGQHPLRAFTTKQATFLASSNVSSGSFQDANTSNFNQNELLSLAASNLEEITPDSEVTEMTIDDGTTRYIHSFQSEKLAVSAVQPETYTHPYSNRWADVNSPPPRRRVPEPSALLGLIAIASLFGTQQLLMKRS